MNVPFEAVLFNESHERACDGVDPDDAAAIESLDAFLWNSTASGRSNASSYLSNYV
jgi:hypothetical protein